MNIREMAQNARSASRKLAVMGTKEKKRYTGGDGSRSWE